jgi:hypothetical protein
MRARRGGLAAIGLLAAFAMVAAPATAAPSKIPHLRHVFIIVEENENYDTTFGKDSPAPYLANRLTAKGELIRNYYAIGHLSLDNYIAMVSGQAPNPQTQGDCQFFNDFLPGTPTSDGQYVGHGCVYPAQVQTVANQLQGAGFKWKGYMQDMNAEGGGDAQHPVNCLHPAIGAHDDTQSAHPGHQYAARHNPFVYFHSIIDFPTCDHNVIDYSNLRPNLRKERTTPNYSFITPDLCNDGHDEPCVNGDPGGLEQADSFLKKVVPRILHSSAYRNRGLLLILFDEAEAAPAPTGDSTACCNEQTGPNTTTPGIFGPGGGKTGAVALSPCIKPGSVSRRAYNHYSLLRSVEDNFRLPHLGYAGQDGLRPFGPDVFTHPGCGRAIHLHAKPRHAERGEPTTFRFRARAGLPECRRHVQIHFAHKRFETDRHGRAEVVGTLRTAGRHHARASKRDCRPDKASIKVR